MNKNSMSMKACSLLGVAVRKQKRQYNYRASPPMLRSTLLTSRRHLGAFKPTEFRILIATNFTMREDTALASRVLRHGVAA